MPGRQVINIDIDGVLTNGELFWETRPTVNEEIAEFVRQAYYSCKYVIIIWSARLWHDASKTVAWLIENDIPFHAIMMQKGATDVYIDDKCVQPTADELKRLLGTNIDVPLCGDCNKTSRYIKESDGTRVR